MFSLTLGFTAEKMISLFYFVTKAKIHLVSDHIISRPTEQIAKYCGAYI